MKTKLAKTELALIASMLFVRFSAAGNRTFPTGMGRLAVGILGSAFSGLRFPGGGLRRPGGASSGSARVEG